MAAIEAPAEKQGEYDSSRYAPCDAPVTLRQYPRLYEQEPTTGEGGERVNVSPRETSKPGRIVCPVAKRTQDVLRRACIRFSYLDHVI